MYVIRRNNHYYKETVCDLLNYDRLPAPRHLYVTSQRNAKQFATIAEAYAVGDTVGGITVEKVPSPGSITQALSRDELLHRQLLRLSAYIPVSVIAAKLHAHITIIRTLLAGQFASVSTDVKERLSITLQDAPLDERFRDWEDTRFIVGRDKREARFRQLRPLLIQCKVRYRYSQLAMAERFGVKLVTMKNCLADARYTPSAILIYKLEQVLEEHGYATRPTFGLSDEISD